ncbi:hypothetical protein FPV67DRAFT_1430166 [Lyophyllum atratum]|nr:hypothetical protein FPV67DRAFT_1430166 [Lyophyllum atratum]
MSKSRSSTPTPPNTFSANITPSTQSTTSRTHSHEHTPSASNLGGAPRFTSRSTHTLSLPPLSPRPSHRTPRLVRRAESPVADQPMAKRFRKESPQTLGRPVDKSSPSCDSQDDMADTEMDARQKEDPETPAPAVPPPKKKRTRTLTTPHQSAVLHALLAQSRFPTTAMREEVGRSIGLSARKVQNQRQKARRPRSQSDTSRRRFPQYGPFPSDPEMSTLGSFSLSSDQGPSSHMGQGPYSAPHSTGHPTSSGYHSSESISGSLESPTQLLGPGMPGSDLQADLPQRGRPVIGSRPSNGIDACSASSSGHARSRRHFVPSPSPPRLYPPPPSSRPTTTSRLHDRDFSRTLPPLIFNPPSNRSSFSAPGLPGLHPSASRTPFSPTYLGKRSISPEITFAHQPPEAGPAFSHPRHSPYTLQPRPQWETSTFASTLRSSDSPSWTRLESRSSSADIIPSANPRVLRPSATGARRDVNEATPAEGVPPQRTGRYDPVRATFIYTDRTEPPQPFSPEASGSSRHTDPRQDTRDDRTPTQP